jgi:hypothetical protein
VLQQGKEGGERLRKNDNGVSSAGGGGDGEWQRFAVGRKTMATNECSSPVLKQTPPCFSNLLRLLSFQNLPSSFLSSPFFVFIAAGREGHLTTAMAQGKVATLPMSWHRVGWLVMACISGGRVWDVACVFGQVRRARQIGRIAGKDLKSSSSLPLHGHGKRRKVPFKTTLFWCFFFF